MTDGKFNPLGPSGKDLRKPLRIPQVPLEWLDRGNWRLPSGRALAEFALESGFLAPLLLGSGPLGERKKEPSPMIGPMSSGQVSAKEDR